MIIQNFPTIKWKTNTISLGPFIWHITTEELIHTYLNKSDVIINASQPCYNLHIPSILSLQQGTYDTVDSLVTIMNKLLWLRKESIIQSKDTVISAYHLKVRRITTNRRFTISWTILYIFLLSSIIILALSI